jgi:putative spermidine/putrescine transport system substrate-binding protein
MKRSLLLVLAAVLVLAVAALYWFTRPPPVLTVTTWDSPYGRAQTAAQIRAFGARQRVDVRIARWDGDLKALEAAVTARQYPTDVLDFTLPAAARACRDGLLEKLDTGSLPDGTDGTAAARDFIPGALGPCWVGGVAQSQVLLHAPGLARPPATLADFFDTRRFPGRRALSRASPRFTLEMALLADGVKPADIYRTLETPEGLARAFAKLVSIRPIWSIDAVGAMRWVTNGQAVMTAALNTDVTDNPEFPLGIIWDHQVYVLNVFAIPFANPNKALAMDFIRFATGSEPLGALASRVPLGPARRSALAFVGDNPDTRRPMRPILPTAPENFRHAFALDADWWQTHEADILPRWQAFVMRR